MLLLLVIIVGTTLCLTVLFNIQDIKVTGESIYTQEQIIGASGLSVGKNMIRTDVNTAAKNIRESLVYVESSEVKRVFPGTILITVLPCEPSACVDDGGKFLLISKSGKILESLDQPRTGLVAVFGVKVTENAVGAPLKSEDEEQAALLETLLEAISKSEIGSITSVDVEDRYNMSAMYENRVTIEIGTISDVDYKLAYAKKLLAENIGADKEGSIFFRGSNAASFIEKADLERYEQSIYSEKPAQTSVAAPTGDDSSKPAETTAAPAQTTAPAQTAAPAQTTSEEQTTPAETAPPVAIVTSPVTSS